MSDAPPVRCVVFDVDDTLYLERDYVRSGFRAVGAWVAEHLGTTGFAERAWALFERGERGDVFDRALAELDARVDDEVIRRLIDVYRRHDPDIALLPDARECLDRLHARVRIAVVTDGPPESQRAKVAALGLDRWCDPVVVASELGEGLGKPHPRAFELVEEATGCRGAACAYVADNPARDFAGPAALGWRTVRVRRAGGLHESADAGRAVDLVLDDLAGLAHWVLGRA